MSYEISGTTIRLTRGDSFYCTVGMSRAGEPYLPQEGDKIRFALKRDRLTPGNAEYVDKRPLILKTIPNDTLILHIAPEDTKGLDFGQYAYDIEITFANGDVDTFIKAAPFILEREVH